MSNSRTRSFKNHYQHSGLFKTIILLFRIALLKLHVTQKIKTGKNTVLHFRWGTSDLPAFRQIFLDREYDFSVPFEPAIIFDLGANAGFASNFFTTKFPKAKIIAVEPESSNFVQLKKNVAHYPNIQAVQAAVWSEPGKLQIGRNNKTGEWGASIFIKENTSKVTAVTIDELMKKYNAEQIDILKIDVEGSEIEIFNSPSQWINKVKIFVIELHDHLVPECKSTFLKAFAHLNNYSIEERGENTIVRNLNLIR